jgi:hypothetical protein
MGEVRKPSNSEVKEHSFNGYDNILIDKIITAR